MPFCLLLSNIADCKPTKDLLSYTPADNTYIVTCIKPASDYCLRLDGRTFSKTPVERSIVQTGLSCWDLGDRGVLIIGYNYDDNDIGDRRTTDLVSVNGSTSSPGFPLKYKIM